MLPVSELPLSSGVLALGGIGFAGALAKLFVSDEAYPNYKKIFSNLRDLKAISEKRGDNEAELIIKMAETLNAAGEGIQGVYNGFSFIRFTRKVNGISIAMLKSYYLYLSLLNRANLLAAKMSGTERDSFILKVAEQMKDMPGYVFNSSSVRKAYAKLINMSERMSAFVTSSSPAFFNLQDENDPIHSDISLLLTVQSLNGQTPADLRVNVAYYLIKMGARDLAFDVIGAFPSLLIDKILNSEQADAELTRKLRYILSESKRGGSLRRAGYFEQVFKDLYLAEEKIRSRFTGRREALLSLTRTIPAKGVFFGYLPLRAKFEEVDAKNLENQMVQNLNSMEETFGYLDREIKQKGGMIETISPVLVDAIVRRPDWIQSKEDVDLILSRPDLWPQFTGTISESSPLELAFIVGIKKLRDRFPAVWKFEPASAEKLHKVIVARLKALNAFPESLGHKIELWKRLTSRGVTTTTDNLFHEIYRDAAGSQKADLEVLALNDGRVWETEIKAEIAQGRIFQSSDFKDLMASSSVEHRLATLKKLIAETQSLIPEGGRVYWDLLESISVKITSNEAESKLLHESKSLTEGGEKQEDFGLRILSQLSDEALGWSRSDQWALIQYLRGRGQVTKRIQKAFNVVGPERVQRMFDLLPLLARTELIDAFIDSPRGLLGKFNVDRGWGKTILEELFSDKSASEVEIAKEILESFLHALKKTGNGPLRTYVVSYLLSQHQGNSDTAAILKNVLEIFGATGVKIGQFLAASGILPEKETATLRALQEKAKVPTREEIYSDVREVLGKDSVPFRMGDLKGAASIKYAVEVFDNESQKKAILKVFRLEAIAHTRMEFNLLDEMANFLVQRHGTKYGIFRSIVKASRAAVERELVVNDEIKKSLAAQRYIYVNLNEERISVKAPFEALIADRAILAEYAEGSSFFTLRDDLKPIVAKKILTMEAHNLFSDKPVVLFDPDRHAGNYRIYVHDYNGEPHLVLEEIDVAAIDMGQLLKFKPADREQIIELFSISQVLKQVGPNTMLSKRLGEIFGLSNVQQRKLLRQLSMYYPDKGGKEITSYFALLSSLESVGVNINIVQFDFVRSIIQLQQYEPFATKDRTWQTPSEMFAQQVKAKVATIVSGLSLNTSEKMSYAWGSLQGGLVDKLRAFGEIILSREKRNRFNAGLDRNSGSNVTCEQLLEKAQ